MKKIHHSIIARASGGSLLSTDSMIPAVAPYARKNLSVGLGQSVNMCVDYMPTQHTISYLNADQLMIDDEVISLSEFSNGRRVYKFNNERNWVKLEVISKGTSLQVSAAFLKW